MASDSSLPERRDRLAGPTLWLYASPNAAAGFAMFLTSVYLLKYATDVLGIAPAAMGVILLVSRVWDATFDPLVGYLSDRTRSRFGRRRPWMVAGALPFAISFLCLWSPPHGLGSDALVWWIGVAVVVFYSSATIALMPWEALGAELSLDYHERNRIFAARRVSFGIGAIAVFGALVLLTREPEQARAAGLAIALPTSFLIVASLAVAAFWLRERVEFVGRGPGQVARAFADVWRNPHARVLLLVFFIQQLGIASITAIVPYYTDYVLGDPQLVSSMMGVLFVVALASIPVWVWLGRRFEKRSLVLVGMCGVSAALASLGAFGPGDRLWVLLLCAVGGALSAGLDVILPSIQADVVDFDELRSGERKEGVYFALWNFAGKSATGVAAAVVGFALQGMVPEAGAEPTPESRARIVALMSTIPLVTYSLGIALFWRFRLSRDQHLAIRAALESRAQAN